MICDFTDIKKKFLKFSVYDRKNVKNIPLGTIVPVKNYNYDGSNNIVWYPFVTLYCDNNSCKALVELQYP